MRKVCVTLSFFVCMMAGFLFPLQEISAKSYDEFGIQTVIPENQIDKKKSYFDLLMNPDQKQEIEVLITNAGNKVMIVDISLIDATTGNNGVIVYTQVGERDTSAPLTTTDVAKVLDNSLQINPGEEKTVRLELTMPDKKFEGQILGGIVVKGKTTEEETNSDDNISIENEINYVVGLNLTMDEKQVDANLNLKKIEEKLVDHRPAVIANIQNDKPVIMTDAKIAGNIKAKGSDSVLSTVDYEGAKIAPNTNFDVVYDWGGKSISNGTYVLEMKIVCGEDVWEWKEEFEISDADSVNQGNLFKEKNNDNWLLTIIGILIVICIFFILFFLLKRKKRDREEDTL